MRLLTVCCGLLLVPGPAARAQSLTLRSNTPLSDYSTGAAASATILFALLAGATDRLQVAAYNVQNPAAPVLLGLTPINPAPAPAQNALLINSTLFVSLLPVYLSTGATSELLAIDVSNPAAPVLQARVAIQAYGLDLVAGPGGQLCVLPTAAPPGSSYPPTLDNRLLLYNNSLQLIGAASIPAGAARLGVAGQVAYVNYPGGTYLSVSLAVPSMPTPQPAARAGGISAVSGSLGFGLQQPSPYYGAGASNTLYVNNLSAPAAPVQTGAYGYVAVGRDLLAAPGGVFTFTRVSPFYQFPIVGSGPLTGYFPTGAATAPIAVTPADPAYDVYAAAAAGDRLYVLNGTLSIYELNSSLATRPRAGASYWQPYPNPAHDWLHLPQLAAGTAVTVYDALGRCCLQAVLPASGTLDIKRVPAGCYQVRAGAVSGRLVVE